MRQAWGRDGGCNLSPGACLNMRRLQAVCVFVCVSVFIAICVAIFNLAHQLRQHALPATCARLMSASYLCVRVCVDER